jgi:translation initiation factor IF-3
MIRIPQVRVVDEEGAQLGIMPTPQALEMAQERGYDLVEVAPMASPPVVKFLDFGQYKYELTKRDKEAKRRQRSVTFKEVRLTPSIGQGDFDTKVHRAIEFLEEGDRLKVTVRFRGRQLTHPELGRTLIGRFADQIKDHGVIERTPLLEGKSMFVTVASTHKPKPVEEPRAARSDGATRTEPATSTEATPPSPTATPSAASTAAGATRAEPSKRAPTIRPRDANGDSRSETTAVEPQEQSQPPEQSQPQPRPRQQPQPRSEPQPRAQSSNSAERPEARTAGQPASSKTTAESAATGE